MDLPALLDAPKRLLKFVDGGGETREVGSLVGVSTGICFEMKCTLLLERIVRGNGWLCDEDNGFVIVLYFLAEEGMKGTQIHQKEGTATFFVRSPRTK